jgi:hypothetical protein
VSETEEHQGQALSVSTLDGRSVHVLEGKSGRGQKYDLNYCCGITSDQCDFFEGCGIKNLLDSVVDGYSATCLAYGQVRCLLWRFLHPFQERTHT